MGKLNIEDFYLFFENKHRGSEELIKNRLGFYRGLINCYLEFEKTPKALDLGCGRGEFLEILREEGFDAEGIDINEHLIKIAETKGLNVIREDALSFVRKKEDHRYNLISMIHLAEHLSFNYLFELVREIYRILLPGGSLIIETPYTKNIVLGTYNFWLDPTHIKPVNVELIKALGEYIGFSHFEYFPLQSIKNEELSQVRLLDSFYTTSPDVAMVLIKKIDDNIFIEKILHELSSMKKETTVDLEEILDIYERQVRQQIELVEKLKEEIKIQRQELNNQKEEIRKTYLVAYDAQAKAISVVTSQFWRSYDKLRKLRKLIIRKKKEVIEKFKKIKKFEKTLKSTSKPCLTKEELIFLNRIKIFRGKSE